MENKIYYCTKCGTKYFEGTKFCSECGKNLNEVVEEKSNIEENRFQSKSSNKNIFAIIGIVIGIAIGTAIGYGITPTYGSLNNTPTLNQVITMKWGDGTNIDPDDDMGWACKKGRTYIFAFSLICGTSGGFIGAKLSKK